MASSHYVSAVQQSPQSATFPSGNGDFDAKPQDPNDQWSGDESLDEQGNRKRKRPMSVSCELCKQRKVKCDRGQPTCGWCAKNGQICEYKERKKPGLRAGYGRELEARLDRLESILQQQQQIIAQLTNGTSLQALSAQAADANVFSHPLGVSENEPAATSEGAEYEQRPGTYAGQGAQNVADFKGGLGIPFGGYQQATQPPADKGEHPMIQPNLEAYNPAPTAGLKHAGIAQTDGRSAIGQDDDLPPYDILYSLVDLYFKHVNTWCPILQRRTTFDALFSRGSLDEGDRALLHAIVATTMRFCVDGRLTEDRKAHYHALSKQRILLYGLETSSVKSLQALVILALDMCGKSNGPPGWNILAVITRSAVQLGLSVETTSQLVAPRHPSIYTLRELVLPEPVNFIEDESRRRLFWMIYILDRYATIITAFDFALDDKEIDRRLPCRDDLYAKNQLVETRWFRADASSPSEDDRPENLGSFSFYVEVMGVLSRIHQFLKKPVDIQAGADVERWQAEYRQLDHRLSSWKERLPKEYGNMNRLFDSSSGNKIVNCGWVMLHATFFTTTIRLHSSAAYPSNSSALFSPSLAASKRCQDAVRQTMALCNHVLSAGLLNKLGPPFAFSVWVAARLMLVHSATIEHHINPEIGQFVDVLRQMGQQWAVADRYASVLQRVLEEFAASEGVRNSASDKEQATPATVRILTDMRKCAYDLDFMISQQPRSTAFTENQNQTNVPGRTAATNELEYLDMFDFFNMPRLPVPPENSAPSDRTAVNGVGLQPAQEGTTNDFDATIGPYDPGSDWLR